MRYFTLCECKLFVYVVLVVVVIVYQMLATIVKCLGLMARRGARQVFSICISIIIQHCAVVTDSEGAYFPGIHLWRHADQLYSEYRIIITYNFRCCLAKQAFSQAWLEKTPICSNRLSSIK